MRNIVRQDARRLVSVLPKVDRDLDVVIGKALENRPKDRYASAEEFAADLRRFANLQPIAARPMGSLDWTRKWLRRNKTLSWGLAATILSLLLGVNLHHDPGQSCPAGDPQSGRPGRGHRQIQEGSPGTYLLSGNAGGLRCGHDTQRT